MVFDPLAVDPADLEREDNEIRRAEEARQLLEHPMLAEAFKYLRETWTHALVAGPIDQPKVLQAARLRLEILGLVERELQEVLESGSLAATRKDDREQLAAWIEEDHAANG